MSYLLASALFLLAPIALVIHLAASQYRSSSYKVKIAYVYGSIWAIALLYFFWLFVNSIDILPPINRGIPKNQEVLHSTTRR